MGIGVVEGTLFAVAVWSATRAMLRVGDLLAVLLNRLMGGK